MPAAKKSVTKKPTASVANTTTTPSPSKTNPVLDEFDYFILVTKKQVLKRMEQLAAQGVTDYPTCKMISNKILTDCFRGCKWSP